MLGVLGPLDFLLIALAGWVNQRQLLVVEYVLAENRTLKQQLDKKPLRLTDDQRRLLAVKGRVLGASLLTADGVEVLDVNHHGSESSTSSSYMNRLTPTAAVINTGSGQGANFRYPRVDVVENVLMAQAACVTAPPALVLQTEDGQPAGTNTSTEGFCVGDIVIQTSGVGTFQISATGDVSQGPDERAVLWAHGSLSACAPRTICLATARSVSSIQPLDGRNAPAGETTEDRG